MDYLRLNYDSVAWAYESSAALLRDELARVASLNEKAAQLAGFSGVILTVLATLADDGFGVSLGYIGDVAFAVGYFGGAVCLAAAVCWLVLFVYRPRRFVTVDPAEISNYLADDRLLQSEPWALQIRTMRTMSLAASWADKAAAQMAKRITIGAYTFLAGLVFLLVAVATLGLANL